MAAAAPRLARARSRAHQPQVPSPQLPAASFFLAVVPVFFAAGLVADLTGAALVDGTTVEAGRGPLHVEELNLPAGEYVIGFVVEDLDGNATASYTPIAVQ